MEQIDWWPSMPAPFQSIIRCSRHIHHQIPFVCENNHPGFLQLYNWNWKTQNNNLYNCVNLLRIILQWNLLASYYSHYNWLPCFWFSVSLVHAKTIINALCWLSSLCTARKNLVFQAKLWLIFKRLEQSVKPVKQEDSVVLVKVDITGKSWPLEFLSFLQHSIWV